MLLPACPDWMRRCHASAEEPNVPRAAGISRVALVPSWWQAVQPPDFNWRTHSAWLLTREATPVPAAAPVNALLSGTCKRENQ
jgi:hypothetical protein